MCPACPHGTGEHRLKAASGVCPNEACINYVSFRKGPYKRKNLEKAGKAAMAELGDALEARDENGHRIVALKYRIDVCTLRDAVVLLRASKLPLESIIFLAGFLHILYWPWPIMTVATMFLECAASNGIRCWCALDRSRAGVFLIDIGKKVHDFYDKVCCHEGRSLLLRSHKKYRSGNFPHPTMNPMMRKGSRQQWDDLVHDVRKGGWQKLCQMGARLVENGMENNGIKMSYKAFFDMMSTFQCRLYAATSSTSASHYNTVHFNQSSYVCFGLVLRPVA